MSEVANYEKISLGQREEYFIQLFGQHSFSAYELFTFLKNNTNSPLAYKNVHDRIKRLVTLGLLQEQEGHFKRNAIKYKLTSRGLFEYLSLGYLAHPLVWLDYKENIIMQTLLFNNFEIPTIRKMTQAGYICAADMIGKYLKKCCDSILLTLNRFKEHEQKFGEHKTFQEGKDEILRSYLYTTITNELNDFVLAIVRASGGEKVQRFTLFPIPELRKDKKFMGILQQTKQDSDSGYTQFFD